MLLRRSRNRPGAARIRSWLVLLAGFGGLLALVITAGANALVSLDHLRSREAATRRVFLARNGDLEQIRSAIQCKFFLLGATGQEGESSVAGGAWPPVAD
jgi:hypothetical protein